MSLKVSNKNRKKKMAPSAIQEPTQYVDISNEEQILIDLHQQHKDQAALEEAKLYIETHPIYTPSQDKLNYKYLAYGCTICLILILIIV